MSDNLTIPPVPPLPAPPKRKPRPVLWIILGGVALIALIIGVGAANSPAPAPAADKPAAAAPAKPAEEAAAPAPTVRIPIVSGKTIGEARAAFAGLPLDVTFPDGSADNWVVTYVASEGKPVEEGHDVLVLASGPAAGSLESPHPPGYVSSLYQGDKSNTIADVTVSVKDWNAGAAIAQANQFNEPAAPGYHYVAVEYTFTGTNPTEPANVSLLLYDWSLAQADGTLIGESNSASVLPDGWNETYDVNDLYQGQTGSAVVLYQVPDGYTGPLMATAYGQYISL